MKISDDENRNSTVGFICEYFHFIYFLSNLNMITHLTSLNKEHQFDEKSADFKMTKKP